MKHESRKPTGGSVLLRLISESVSDDQWIKKTKAMLVGTDAMAVTPDIGGKMALSLIFNLHTKRAGSSK